MATAADYLQTAYDQACERLSELDAQDIDTKVRGTYTVSGVAVNWNEYRAALINQIKELGGADGKTGLIVKAAGPFEVHA